MPVIIVKIKALSETVLSQYKLFERINATFLEAHDSRKPEEYLATVASLVRSLSAAKLSADNVFSVMLLQHVPTKLRKRLAIHNQKK